MVCSRWKNITKRKTVNLDQECNSIACCTSLGYPLECAAMQYGCCQLAVPRRGGAESFLVHFVCLFLCFERFNTLLLTFPFMHPICISKFYCEVDDRFVQNDGVHFFCASQCTCCILEFAKTGKDIHVFIGS